MLMWYYFLIMLSWFWKKCITQLELQELQEPLPSPQSHLKPPDFYPKVEYMLKPLLDGWMQRCSLYSCFICRAKNAGSQLECHSITFSSVPFLTISFFVYTGHFSWSCQLLMEPSANVSCAWLFDQGSKSNTRCNFILKYEAKWP